MTTDTSQKPPAAISCHMQDLTRNRSWNVTLQKERATDRQLQTSALLRIADAMEKNTEHIEQLAGSINNVAAALIVATRALVLNAKTINRLEVQNERLKERVRYYHGKCTENKIPVKPLRFTTKNSKK